MKGCAQEFCESLAHNHRSTWHTTAEHVQRTRTETDVGEKSFSFNADIDHLGVSTFFRPSFQRAFSGIEHEQVVWILLMEIVYLTYAH